MPLPLEADPDRQMPMPFPAADDYAQAVMRWARELDTAGINVQRDVAYGPHRLHRYNVFSPASARNAPVLMWWHGGGWTNGYRDYVSFMALNIVRMACVLVARCRSASLSPRERNHGFAPSRAGTRQPGRARLHHGSG